jgi:hypothetical protein
VRFYTVHIQLQKSGQKHLELVKEGFSWPAFLFDVFWAVHHRAWLTCCVLTAAICVFCIIGYWQVIAAPLLLVVVLGWRVAVGFHGNDWRCTELARHGFQVAGVVSARDYASAVQRFLDKSVDRSSLFLDVGS